MRTMRSDEELASLLPSMLQPRERIDTVPLDVDDPGPVGALALLDDSPIVPTVNGAGRCPPRSSLIGSVVDFRYFAKGGGGSPRSAYNDTVVGAGTKGADIADT
jgi:hypothetical protein